MAAESTLRSYLIRLGFKVDEQQYRNYQEVLKKTANTVVSATKGFVELGKASIAAGTVMGTALTVAATNLEKLYFASQRTGASAKELQAFGFAAEQIGISAEQAQAAIQSLSQARIMNPGLNGILAGLKIDPRQTDNAKVMVELLARLHNMPAFQGARIAQQFGIDPQTFMQMERNLPELIRQQQIRSQMFKTAGIDPDRYDKQAHEFMVQIRTMGAEVLDFTEILSSRMFPIFEKIIRGVERFVEFGIRADKATSGWSTRIVGLVVALKSLTTAFGIFSKLSGLSKLAAPAEKAVARRAVAGVATEAEEAAGGAAAAAEGGGLLALVTPLLPVLIPLIVGAAAASAIVWATLHPEKVRKAASWAWDKEHKLEVKVANAAVKEVKAIPSQAKTVAHRVVQSVVQATRTTVQQVQKAGGIGNVVSIIPSQLAPMSALADAIKGAADFTAGWEAKLQKWYMPYKDIAGHLTVGFGHLVKAGENFAEGLSLDQAKKLLTQDMAKAAAEVSRLVKVHLTANQRAALNDFEFNTGKLQYRDKGGHLVDSTLLKELNAGHYQAAADQFAYWNKALINGHYESVKGLTNRRMAEAQLYRTPDAKPSVTLHQDTKIIVEASPTAAATAKDVANLQSRTNGDMVRNSQVAFQ